jgi:hypothetical protein
VGEGHFGGNAMDTAVVSATDTFAKST